jgi:hypothetical protein
MNFPKALRVLSTGSAVFAALAFVLLRVGTVQRLLSPSGKPLPVQLVVLGAAAIAIASWVYALCFSAEGYPSLQSSATSLSFAPPRRDRRLLALLVTILVFIGVRSFTELTTTTMDWDEYAHSAHLAIGDYSVSMDPFHFGQHTLSSIFSTFSMLVAGASPGAARAPAVLFTLVFLVAVFLLCSRHLSTFASVILVAHLAVNPWVRWYLHSQRGYAALLAITTLGIFFIFEWHRGYLEFAKASRILLILFFTALFVHLFAALHFFCLFFAIAVCMAIHRNSWSPEKVAEGKKLLMIPLYVGPIFAVLAVGSILSLSSYGHVLKANEFSIETNLVAILETLGLYREYWLRTFTVLALALWLYACRKRIELGFQVLIAPITFLFFVLVIYALKADPYTRLYLGMIIPFVLMTTGLLEDAFALTRQKLVWAVALILFVAAPLQSHVPQEISFGNRLTAFTKFMKTHRDRYAQPGTCTTASGDSWLVKFSVLYIPPQTAMPCEREVNLHFVLEGSLEGTPVPPKYADWRLVESIDNENGHYLLLEKQAI